MSTSYTPSQGSPPPTETRSKKPLRKRWWVWLLLAVVVLGVLGAIVGRDSDPTTSKEYRALQTELSDAQHSADNWKATAQTAQARADQASQRQSDLDQYKARLDQRSAELDQREAALKGREDAVTQTEQQVAASSITEGTWTVGRDVEPGTYHTKDLVSGSAMCYWEISKTGETGIDAIVDNDIVTGGRPTVTISAGQDFTTRDCGTWVKD